MRYLRIARKTATILANLSLFLNTFLPFVLAAQPAYAQTPEEAAPPIVDFSPTPEDSPTPPENPSITPNPEITVTPEPTIFPEIIPSPEATPSPEIVTPEVFAEPSQPLIDPIFSPEPTPSAEPSITPTTIPTPTPEKPVDQIITQICLTGSETITDSLAINWNYDQEKDIYETKEKVKLGVKYIFPQDNNVTVTFKCLPTNDSLLSTLKIKRIKTSELNLPDNTNNISEYAYDITTGMIDGTFKYDITLPKTANSEASIAYIEKSLDEAKQNISTEEIKSVSQPEQQTDKVIGKDINHFTIFITTYQKVGVTLTLKDKFKLNNTVVVVASGHDLTKTKIIIKKPDGSEAATCESFDDEFSCEYKIKPNDPTGTWYIDVGHLIFIVWDWDENYGSFEVVDSICSDGQKDPGEICDDGLNNGQYGYCNSTCTGTGARCGDNLTTSPQEICDGNTIACKTNKNYNGLKTCKNTCTSWESCLTTESCGDGIINGDEQCDGSNLNGLSSADFSCNPQCNLDLVNAKVNICHSTNSQSNPYNLEQPNKSADVSGHADHTGVVWYPGVADHSWGDIIPPFAYIGGTFPGLNWTTQGQAVYNNGCNLPNSTLKIVKTLINTGGGNKSVSDFKFSRDNGLTQTYFETDGINEYSVAPGQYDISEIPELNSKYTVSYDQCSGIIGIGETKICTVTNTYMPYCGDGVKFGSEECDDGNLVNNDGCTNSCKNPTCGDGFINPATETCDDGADNALTCIPTYGSSCSYCKIGTCETKTIVGPYCGDGIVNSDHREICDDGNLINGDGCSSTCNFEPGTITFIKNATPDDNQSFHFTYGSNNYPVGDFDLVDDNNGDNSHTTSFSSIPAGTYSWTESTYSGWDLTNISCDDDDSNWDLATKTVNVVLSPAEHVTCTITNTKRAKLTIIKQVDTNNDGVIENQNDTNWTWDIANGEQNITTGQSRDLIPGSYTITEDQKSDYRLKQWSCSNNTNGITNSIGVTLNPGEDVTCTITNTRKTGNIKVCKVILDGDKNIVDGSALPNSVFTISGLNQSTSQGVPAGVLGATTFTTPLTLNEKLFGSRVNNAACVTYENLIPGNYYYSQESLPVEFWGTPKYNDSTSQRNINDHFYEYSSQLFDENPANDGSRQTSSDGHIVLNYDQTRTLIILNQYQYAKVNVTKYNDFNGNGLQDQGEENLSGWTINLTGQTSTPTNINGLATFTNVATGSHLLSENLQDGWMQTNIICDGQEGTDNDNSHEITLTAGQTLNCKIGNRQLGKVTVYKFNDTNGNGQKDEGESNLSDWTINLTNQTSLNTDANGQVIFNNLVPGNYDLSENIQSQAGWKQTNIYCEDRGEGVKITAPGEAYGHHGNCSGWNSCGNAATCALWACEVKGFNHLVSYGAEKPCTQFGNCNLFNSRGSVQYNWGNWCQVMGVTDIVCSNGSESNGYYNNGYLSGNHLTVNPGQNKICYIGNQRLSPKLNISKSNNTGGSELSPGNSVEYKITLGITDNSVNNLKVTDLLSDGFKYRLGSYKILKTTGSITTDVTSQVGEPQYHSPGVWDLSSLGQLTPEDEIELIYTADISSDQQAGKYADLAYASAVYGYDSEKSLLAVATDEGKVDENYVGTDVTINRNSQNSISAGVEKTEVIDGQVLGASTEMPATGAATLWLIISSILGSLGLILIKHDKITKSMAKKIFSIFVLPLFLFLISGQIVFAESSLSVRLEQPKTPSNIKDLHLKFVALDISGNTITAKCLKKGPIDSDFSQYDSDIILSAGGNASQCNTLSAIDRVGSYQFKVEANGVSSNIVSVDYQDIAPGTPTDYRKESLNGNCDFKIHFRTANDEGRTVKVELYRSTDSAFTANNDSLVHSVNIGSTQEADINNSVPDCSKTYYYALRAFDSAGNGSDMIGDTITVKTIYNQTSVTGTPAQGAIPVVGSNIPGESDNDQNVSGDNQSENSNQDQSAGQILGTQTKSGNFITKHKIISGTIAIVILAIIIYAFKKIRQGKKNSRRK